MDVRREPRGACNGCRLARPARIGVPARQDWRVTSSARYVEQRIERTYRVRFDEAGPDGNLRSGGYRGVAQEMGWIHAEGAGFGRDWYGEHGLFWLVRGVELEILEAIEFGTK